MLDDLRDEVSHEAQEEPFHDPLYDPPSKPVGRPFMGMSAGQRFIIALFIFLMTAVLGVFVLIVLQKITPPIG